MMRRAVWIIATAAVLGVTVIWPLIAWLQVPQASGTVDSVVVGSAPASILWTRTAAWSIGIGLAATLLGWGPGRLFANRLRAGRGGVVLVGLLWPLLVPAYVLFYSLWQSWPVDSPVHEWLVRIDGLVVARQITLAVALVLWFWPLAALCIAPVAATWAHERDDQLALDAAGWGRRLWHRARHDAPGLVVAVVFVAMLVFANTTCFDLAGVFTVANELRAMESMGGEDAMRRLGWPAVVLAVIGAVLVLRCLDAPPQLDRQRVVPVRMSAWFGVLVLWCITLPVPIAALWLHAGPLDTETYRTLYGGALGMAILRALCVGMLSLIPLLLLLRLSLDASRVLRLFAWGAAIVWLSVGLMPAALLGSIVGAAWNGGAPGVASSGAALVFALSARTALIPVVIAWWLVRSEPRAVRDARAVEAGHDLPSLWGTMTPRLVPAMCTCIVLVSALAIGDIVLTGLLAPPSNTMPLAVTLLNAMHYQRPEVVVLSLLLLLGWGAVAAVLVGGGVAIVRRAAPRIAPLLVLVLLVGCGDEPPAPVVDPDGLVPVDSLIGHPGRSDGGFYIPRAIAVDQRNGTCVVIDKTGRVQVFDRSGSFLHAWTMPIISNGKPTGVHVDADGLVWVPDTHEFQVLVFDQKGQPVRRFGTFGEAPGEFLYPTDVATGPDGSIWVSEYGGNDRVQVFNADGSLRRVIGAVGDRPGEFSRPQAIALSSDGARLYVADSCNHRIQIFDDQGTLLSILGEPGKAPGQLHYPYDLVLLDDGSLLVSEYGSSRIQHLAPDGTSLGIWGVHGSGPGALNAPWGIDSDGERIWILDTGNHRVVTMDLPD